jgi:hypothetical protein
MLFIILTVFYGTCGKKEAYKDGMCSVKENKESVLLK